MSVVSGLRQFRRVLYFPRCHSSRCSKWCPRARLSDRNAQTTIGIQAWLKEARTGERKKWVGDRASGHTEEDAKKKKKPAKKNGKWRFKKDFPCTYFDGVNNSEIPQVNKKIYFIYIKKYLLLIKEVKNILDSLGLGSTYIWRPSVCIRIPLENLRTRYSRQSEIATIESDPTNA